MVANEEKGTKVEDDVTLLKPDLLKRLEESATEAVSKENWSSLLTVFKGVSREILKTDAQFSLDKMPSMKNVLAFQVREEAAKATED